MTETKVGVFVFAALVAVFFTSFAMKKASFLGSKGIAVSFYVENAAGLVKDAKVKYMGIDIGVVEGVSFEGRNVVIFAVLDPKFQIPDNIVAAVSQDGLVGEKFLALTLPSDEEMSATYLTQGRRYTRHQKQVSFEEIAQKVDSIANDVGAFMRNVNQVLDDERGNMRAIIDNLKASTDVLRDLLEGNKNQIDGIIVNVKDLTDALGKATKGREQEFSDIIDNLNATMAALRNFSADLESVMQGEKDNLSGSISHLRGTMENLNQITKDAHEGKGTLGMLLTDNETRDTLKTVLKGLQEMTAAAGRLAFELEGGLEYIERYGDYRGRVDLKIHPNYPDGGRYYYVGVSNNPLGTIKHTITTTYIDDPSKYPTPFVRYEDEEKRTVDPLVFSLQYAKIFRNAYTVKVGVFDSRLGFGLDYRPFESQRLYFTTEASDFFRKEYGAYVKAGVKYYFLENFFVQTSWDDLASSRSSWAVGGGISFFDNDIKYIITSVPIPK